MSFLSVVFWKQNVQFDALENNKKPILQLINKRINNMIQRFLRSL